MRPKTPHWIDMEEDMDYVAGIDPGQGGAIALIDSKDGLETFIYDMPEDAQGFLQISKDLFTYFRSVKSVCIEHVHSMPKQGVSSSFKFGLNFGLCRMWAATLNCPVTLVSPNKWQKILDSDGGDPKTRSLLFARRRWPAADLHLKKHHGRSDALCIAEYGRKYG